MLSLRHKEELLLIKRTKLNKVKVFSLASISGLVNLMQHRHHATQTHGVEKQREYNSAPVCPSFNAVSNVKRCLIFLFSHMAQQKGVEYHVQVNKMV